MGHECSTFGDGAPDRMKELLEKEKIKVIDDKVQQFSTLFWDPNIELN